MPNDAVKFAGPPSSRRRAAGDVPEAALPDPANQGDVVSSMTPEDDDLADLLPESEAPAPSAGSAVLIHILEDGFTANGQVWYRGQEIEYVVGEKPYEDTKDRYGKTWLDLDDRGQMRNWGKVLLRRGPWPGSDYEDPRAASAERTRSRRASALAGVAPPMTGRR